MQGYWWQFFSVSGSVFWLCFMVLLLVVGNTNNSVDKSYMHLIDDVDKFNAFPWGSVAYMCLVKRTHRARENLENILMKHKKIAFDANGFVLALQVWAYEVLPILSRNCATRIEGVGVRIPRIRKWAATNHLKFDFLNKLLLKSHPESLEIVKPSIDEEETLKKLGVDEFDDSIASLITSEIKPLFCNEVTSTKKEALSDEVGSFKVESENIWSPADMEIMAKRIAELQESMKVVTKIQLESMGQMNKAKKVVHLSNEDGFREQPSKRHCTRSVDLAILLSKPKSAKLCSGVAVENVTKKSFDPNEPHFKGTIMKGFEEWCSGAKKIHELGRLALPFYGEFPVNVNWFSLLLGHRGWLNTAHIESLLNLIWLKSKGDAHVAYLTFMDMGCWAGLISENERTVREVVGPYVCGIQPRHGHLNWSRAAKIFGVGHVNGNHWISFVVCLHRPRIIVYDSNSSSWAKLQGTFTLVAKNLEKMCKEQRIWELRGMAADQHFEILLYDNTPQQVNNADCGVLAIKFFECFLNGVSIDVVDATRCGLFRRSFAKQMFDLALPDTRTVFID